MSLDPFVVEHALGVVYHVANSLDFQDLKSNVVVLVAIMLDVLSMQSNEHQCLVHENHQNFVAANLDPKDLSKPGRGWCRTFREGLPTLNHVPDDFTNASIPHILASVLQKKRTKIQNLCVSYILYLTKKCDLAHPTFICLPPLTEFDALRRKFVEGTQRKTLAELFLALIELFKHQSRNVRFIALSSCSLLIKEKKAEVYSELQTAIMNNEETELSNLIGDLQLQLLALTVSEKEPRIKLEVASCLGELGALDAAFNQNSANFSRKDTPIDTVTQSTGSLTRSIRTQKESNLMKEIEEGSRAHHQLQSNLPWLTCRADFGFLLLTDFFVPALRLAQEPHSQDYSSYAIQQIIQALADSYYDSDFENSEMSEEFKSELEKKHLLELVEPFWRSKYRIQEGERKLLPIFAPGISYASWIGFLAKFCITFLQNQTAEIKERYPFIVFYQSCSSLVRYNSQLCQFIIPYMLLDIVLLGSEDTNETNSMEYMENRSGTAKEIAVAIFQEFLTVINLDLASMSSFTESFRKEEFQQIILSIFGFLDIIYQWTSEILGTIKEKKSKPKAKDKNLGAYQDSNAIYFALNSMINVFPLSKLSQIAFQTQSYARSLRYIELSSVNTTRLLLESDNQQENRAKDVTDQSGLSFSDLMEAFSVKYSKQIRKISRHFSEGEVFLIASIYSELEDSASLNGISVLRKGHIVDSVSKYRYKLIELQGSEDWLNSLLEYELLQNSKEYSDAMLSHSQSMGRPRSKVIAKDSPIYRINRPPDIHFLKSQNNDLGLCEVQSVEKGKLKCLLELGHLENVLGQVCSEYLTM